MKNLFCIISAIKNDYGVFTYQDRFKQLLKTIESIQIYSPNSDIVIYETSYEPIPEQDLSILKKSTLAVIMLYKDPIIQHIASFKKYFNQDLLTRKTLGETIGVLQFLLDLKKTRTVYNRIFKICGRYYLNDNFNKVDYRTCVNNIVIKSPVLWESYAYPLRLWSFDFKLLDKIIELYEFIRNRYIGTTQYIVIEYCMYESIKELNIPVYEVPNLIGIEGYMGLDHSFIYE